MSELPSNWIEASLDELCEFNPRHPRETARGQLVSFVPMPAVDEHAGVIVEHESKLLDEVWKGYTHFQDSDVIFAKITPCMENGKAAVARNLVNGLACGSTEFHVLRTLGAIDPDYLWSYLRQTPFRQDAERAMTGAVGQRRVPTDYLKQSQLPLPPLAEQRRVVAKLGSLRVRSVRARHELDHIPKLIERYKQAILAKAFSGELTSDWRIANRREFTWTTKLVSEVATVASGHTPKGIEAFLSATGTVPWFKVSSMNAPGNETNLITSEFMLPQAALQKLSLRVFPAQTITFPKRGGAIATNKKRRLKAEAALDLNLMALIPEQVQPDYLWWWVQALDLSMLSNGSNVPQINHGDIAPLEIMMPADSDEQDEVARRIAQAWIWLDKIATEHARAEHLLPKLDQAVLAQAFRGELVSQDPNDEPASVLLERIKAERQDSDQPRRRRARSA